MVAGVCTGSRFLLGGRMMAELYLLDATDLQEYMSQALAELPQEEQNRILQIRTPKQRVLSLAARILLYKIGHSYGITDFHMTHGKHGKPVLSAMPQFQFNLSHSGNFAALAYSTLPVGVDVEQVREYIPKHLEKILSPEEQIFLEQQENQFEVFTKLWTRKESFVKWKGERIFRFPNQWNMVDTIGFVQNFMGCQFCDYALTNHIISLCITDTDSIPQEVHILMAKDIFS